MDTKTIKQETLTVDITYLDVPLTLTGVYTIHEWPFDATPETQNLESFDVKQVFHNGSEITSLFANVCLFRGKLKPFITVLAKRGLTQIQKQEKQND